MLKDVGLVVNCGRMRLSKPVKSSVMLNFAFAIEVPEEEASEVIDELRSAVQETIGSWSRACWRKMKKQERERKRVK